MRDAVAARASAIFERLDKHRAVRIRRIRERGFYRSGVAVDREVGRYLEGSRSYEERLLRIVADRTKVESVARDREIRRESEAERSLAMDRRIAASMTRPAKSVAAAMRQHEMFESRSR